MKNSNFLGIIFILLTISHVFSYPDLEWPMSSVGVENVSSTFGPRNQGTQEWQENDWQDNNNDAEYNYDFHRGIDIAGGANNVYAIMDCKVAVANDNDDYIVLISEYFDGGAPHNLFWRYVHIEKESFINNYYDDTIPKGTKIATVLYDGENTHLDVKFYDDEWYHLFENATHPLECLDYDPDSDMDNPTAENFYIGTDDTGKFLCFDVLSDNNELDVISVKLQLNAFSIMGGAYDVTNFFLSEGDQCDRINYDQRYNCGDGTVDNSDDGFNNYIRILPYIYSQSNSSHKVKYRFYIDESVVPDVLDNLIYINVQIVDGYGDINHIYKELNIQTGSEDNFLIIEGNTTLMPSESGTYSALFIDGEPFDPVENVTWSLFASSNEGPVLIKENSGTSYPIDFNTWQHDWSFTVPSLIGLGGNIWTRDPENEDYVKGFVVVQGTNSNDTFTDMMDVLIYHKVVSGPITGHTEWRLSVFVEDTVTVLPDVTLFIDYGTRVKFAPDACLIVNGRLWADNTIFEAAFEEKWGGIYIDGDYASVSRVTDSIIKDCIDGFTITNSSPLIKTSEIRNVVKRGFNIKGIDAEPEIRQCYVHSCGTYPVQVLYEADPKIVDSRLYGGSKTAARIWGADGEYSRNEFRSEQGSGAFLFSSSANPMFYSFADSGGNVFDMDNIGAHGIFIGGGYPEFGHDSYYNGYNSFKNKGGKYYFYNDTPGTILAELNWWPNGTSFYNSDGGSIDFQPRLLEEPPSGPLSKTTVSPYATGFEKFRKKDYENAMTELKEALKQDKNSSGADKAVFQLAKSARKIGRLGELEPLLGNLQKNANPQIQYQCRNWLCYLYAGQNNMSKAEKLVSEVPEGSSLERTLLLDLCSYYTAWKDSINATRIADILRSRHSDDVLEMELEAALEGYVDFHQVRGKTKVKRPVIDPALEPEKTAEADTLQFKTGIYPNPFNASTTVHFNLEDDGHVNIVVYDLLGRKVKTLADENRSSGAHRVVWDGRDESGMTASSGIYFVRIQRRDNIHTMKILFVK